MPEAAAAAERKIRHTDVRLVRGDLTLLDVDAIVFYARPDLQLGSGVGTALSVRGGPSLQKELAGKAPVATGESVITGGGNLKARHVVHAVGPRFQEEDIEGRLRATMRSALRRAEEKGCKTIAFPPMGTGFYGIPLDTCARVMLEAIREHAGGETGLKEILLCVMDSREFKPFEAQLSRLNRGNDR